MNHLMNISEEDKADSRNNRRLAKLSTRERVAEINLVTLEERCSNLEDARTEQTWQRTISSITRKYYKIKLRCQQVGNKK